MKNYVSFFIFQFLVFSATLTVAEAPPVALPATPSARPRMDDLQKESSSFVADPDPLDPLPVKKESLKEDEEPVLEDIKSVLNSPTKKKTKSQETSVDHVKPSVLTATPVENRTSVGASEKKPKKTKKEWCGRCTLPMNVQHCLVQST